MKGYKLSKDWILVWGVTFLISGLIIAIGYINIETDNSTVRPNEISNEATQATVDTSLKNTSLRVSSTSNQIEPSTEQIVIETKVDEDFKEELKLVFGLVEDKLRLEDFPSPVNGEPIRNIGNYYSEEYGSYSYHAGIDYALAEGTVIRATHGGKVIKAGQDPILGQKVTLDCGEGWLVTYGGLDNLRVQEGKDIEAQGALGQVGLFSGSEGNGQPQLHYEVWHNGQVQRIDFKGIER
ncbi:M23 family metallopeptidase [Desulfosporosinus meridiei]|uniref:Metalloendopeptidase-like membrane protein n=1 Tax=Desulfosporosinus meridiei (strain ATCC BAA-275 / DSM 13257 / KCTC 12902 / NCIMB 13706 / S10) TaxID=768704 RepID=J7IX97_DESMD|nr:M23 family metallopeptidase [Desulfosporosinus meridiei]AFQ46355.1 metalloendopeptidase-like membrane protein [Desulfosporosinus meridiei DSM 13257]